ncbi:MAG: hypothetical protein WB930_18245 [Syntrophobacteraceae bacterium]
MLSNSFCTKGLDTIPSQMYLDILGADLLQELSYLTYSAMVFIDGS